MNFLIQKILLSAVGAKTGYWFDEAQPPGYDNEQFITEYFGGPIMCLSYDFKRLAFVAKGGINFGTKTCRFFNAAPEPPEFAMAPEFSLGLRVSTYTGKDSSGKSESIKLRPQAVFIEIFGPTFDNVVSLNYEYIIADHFALRAGFSFWMYDSPFFRFPVSASYLYTVHLN